MISNYITLDYYQDTSALTAIYPPDGGLYYTALGLTGEAGEVANKVKKVYRDKHGQLTPEVRLAIAEELGDVLWYVANLATEIGVRLEDVAVQNIDKLRDRQIRGALRGSGDKR